MQSILNGYGIVFAAVSGYLLLVALLNIAYSLRMPGRPQKKTGPLVSVLIPARNEADTIGECLEGLVGQTYENYEIVVLDDGSTDDTPKILESYEKRYEHLRVIRGKEKPTDWKGKAFAVQQLAEAADGEYLYIVDADTRHGPDAVSWAVSLLELRNLEAFSAMPRQITVSFAEKLLVPIVFLPIVFVPLQLFNASHLRFLSFGIGQFFMFRRKSFFRFGGMETVKDEITEDLALSREFKRRGFRYEYLCAGDNVSCRMYGGFRESVQGFTKNIYDIVAKAPIAIALVAPVVLILFVFPFLVLAGTALAAVMIPAWTVNWILLTGAALFLAGWGIHLFYYKQTFLSIFLAPIFFGFLVALVYHALSLYHRGKKPVWKSRKVQAAGS